MGDQQDPCPRQATSIALGKGTCLRSPQSRRTYVIICGSGVLRSRGPFPMAVAASLLWHITLATIYENFNNLVRLMKYPLLHGIVRLPVG
ncbi:hypothetical protein GOBAR_DD33699 [Gossypium barbadense]|nr:hypothetical protein GOBAR_DD33699 [Gossypium barbadense]